MPPAAPKFTNKYFERTAGTSRPCYVCYKETTTVLATAGTTDFLYTCPSHLSDPGFAALIPPPPAPAAVSQPTKEQITAIVREYEKKGKGRKQEGTDGEPGKEIQEGKEGIKSPPPPSMVGIPGANDTAKGAAAPQVPTHRAFTLHRDFFALRLSEEKKRANHEKAKTVAKEMPRVPAGFSSSPIRPRPGTDGGGIV